MMISWALASAESTQRQNPEHPHRHENLKSHKEVTLRGPAYVLYKQSNM
jgi:hypothetical protein